MTGTRNFSIVIQGLKLRVNGTDDNLAVIENLSTIANIKSTFIWYGNHFRSVDEVQPRPLNAHLLDTGRSQYSSALAGQPS